MRTLDLFTGIGGMALALRGYTKPILYCEIDEACRAVLSERMRAGDIERAPVHGDARTLFAAHLGLEMIVGGFPCQDISSMGTNSGVHGRRSSLFFEIMRVIDESPTVECVFLENVANIVSCDLEVVLRELAARGFTVHWTTRSAGEHGAPHVRQRWFALAHRGEGAAKCAALMPLATELAPWPTEPLERCALRPTLGPDELFDPHWARRCRMLGNALVPCVARGAFEYLARAASVIEPLMLVAPLIGVRFATEAPSAHSAPSARFPRDATLLPGGVVCAHTGRECHDESAATIDTRVANGPDLIHVPTPRHGNVYGGPASERNLRGTLGVFLVNCEISKARAIERGASADVPMHKQIVPNPRYIEWLMGFPEDWTRVQVVEDEPRRRVRNAPGPEGPAEGPQPEEGHEGPGSGPTTTTSPRVFRKNGMHVLMSERSLGVRSASLLWRALSAAERGVYSERARRDS